MNYHQTEETLFRGERSFLKREYFILALTRISICIVVLVIFFLPAFFLLLVKSSRSSWILFILFGIPALSFVSYYLYQSLYPFYRDLKLNIKIRHIGTIKSKETKRMRDPRMPWKMRRKYFVFIEDRLVQIHEDVFNQLYPGDEVSIEVLPYSKTVLNFYFLNDPAI